MSCPASSPDDAKPRSRLWIIKRILKATWAACPGRSTTLRLVPIHGVVVGDQAGHWNATGADPQFLASDEILGGPLTMIEVDIEVDSAGIFQVFWAGEGGFTEESSLVIPIVPGRQRLRAKLGNPARTLRLRIDPTNQHGRFQIHSLRLRNSLLYPAIRKALDRICNILAELKHHTLGSVRGLVRSRNSFKDVNPGCDIIIPIYNGIEVVPACIKSVLKNSPAGCRITIIDDASPDLRIGAYLASVEDQRDPRVTILRNSHNLGFVGTVNRGMQQTSGHSILLNSDTEVPPGWVERLIATWAMDPHRIGTVTAMSNNATICSFPRFNKDNALWPGMDHLAIDRAFASQPRRFIALPTAIGFCMFISRQCLERTGWFDEDSFGRGYGEENDFCVRAQRQGYRSVAATDLFVYHKGSVSFGIESKPALAKNYAILVRKWPFYPGMVSAFIRKDPLAEIRHQVAVSLISRMLTRDRQVIGMLLPASLHGGTLRHVLDLMRGISAKYHVFVMKPGASNVTVSVDGGPEVVLDVPSRLIPTWLRDLVRMCNLSVIHVHHLIGINPYWMDSIRSAGVPFIFTAHDFYSACPSYALLNCKGIHCGGEVRRIVCQTCIVANQHAATRFVDIHHWRRRWRKFLGDAAAVIVPTESSRTLLRRYFPDLPIQVIGHGVADATAPIHLELPEGPLHIAFLGAIGINKGSFLVEALASHIAKHKLPYRLTVIGHTEKYQVAGSFLNGNITVTGPYLPSEVGTLLRLHRPHFILHPAIWPETFSYTLSEAWSHGIPVLGSSLGAIGERIMATGAGWCLDEVNIEEVLRHLAILDADRTRIATAAQLAAAVRHTSLSRMAEIYVNLYDSLDIEKII